MSNADPASPLSPELIAVLLQDSGVRQAMAAALEQYGVPQSLEDFPAQAQASLLIALVKDGVIQIGPGRVLSPEETLDFFDRAAKDP